MRKTLRKKLASQVHRKKISDSPYGVMVNTLVHVPLDPCVVFRLGECLSESISCFIRAQDWTGRHWTGLDRLDCTGQRGRAGLDGQDWVDWIGGAGFDGLHWTGWKAMTGLDARIGGMGLDGLDRLDWTDWTGWNGTDMNGQAIRMDGTGGT